MSVLFRYDVDRDTMGACLGILARAAARAARGESALLGDHARRGNAMSSARRANPPIHAGKFAPIPDETRRAIIAKFDDGKTAPEIARAVGRSEHTVSYVTRGLRRLNPMRRSS